MSNTNMNCNLLGSCSYSEYVNNEFIFERTLSKYCDDLSKLHQFTNVSKKHTGGCENSFLVYIDKSSGIDHKYIGHVNCYGNFMNITKGLKIVSMKRVEGNVYKPR